MEIKTRREKAATKLINVLPNYFYALEKDDFILPEDLYKIGKLKAALKEPYVLPTVIPLVKRSKFVRRHTIDALTTSELAERLDTASEQLRSLFHDGSEPPGTQLLAQGAAAVSEAVSLAAKEAHTNSMEYAKERMTSLYTEIGLPSPPQA